jgi:hypothetical protein
MSSIKPVSTGVKLIKVKITPVEAKPVERIAFEQVAIAPVVEQMPYRRVRPKLRTLKKKWPKDEHPANLALWTADGCTDTSYPFDSLRQETTASTKARRLALRKYPEVSIGRTASGVRLGFEIRDKMQGMTLFDFALSREQVIDLRDFCDYQLRRMKPLAAKPKKGAKR